jgi:methylphosphotriester-DNA--protein-cysteine methyltransferase
MKKKTNESMNNVSVQLRHPESPGSRGLAFARTEYQKHISKNSQSVVQGAVDSIAWSLTKPSNVDQILSEVSYKFKIPIEDLHRAFKKNYGMTVTEFAKASNKKFYNDPKKI